MTENATNLPAAEQPTTLDERINAFLDTLDGEAQANTLLQALSRKFNFHGAMFSYTDFDVAAWIHAGSASDYIGAVSEVLSSDKKLGAGLFEQLDTTGREVVGDTVAGVMEVLNQDDLELILRTDNGEVQMLGVMGLQEAEGWAMTATGCTLQSVMDTLEDDENGLELIVPKGMDTVSIVQEVFIRAETENGEYLIPVQ